MSKAGLQDNAGKCKRHRAPASAVGVHTLLGLREDEGGVGGVSGLESQVWRSRGGVGEFAVLGKENAQQPLIA